MIMFAILIHEMSIKYFFLMIYPSIFVLLEIK